MSSSESTQGSSSSSSSCSTSSSTDTEEDAGCHDELMAIPDVNKKPLVAQESIAASSSRLKTNTINDTMKIHSDSVVSSIPASAKPKIRLSLQLPISKQGKAIKQPSSLASSAVTNKAKVVRSKGPTFASVTTIIPSVASSKAKPKNVVGKNMELMESSIIDTSKLSVEKKRKKVGELTVDTNNDTDVLKSNTNNGQKKRAGSPKAAPGTTKRRASSRSPLQPESDTSHLQSQGQQQTTAPKPQFLFTGGMKIPQIKLPQLQSPGLIIHPSIGMSNTSSANNASSSSGVMQRQQQQQAATAPTTAVATAINTSVGGGGVSSSGSALSTHALHSEKTSAANIFVNTMKNIGYIFPSFSTLVQNPIPADVVPDEKPTSAPELTHRGSSTVRSVQDIFDRWIPGKEAKTLLPKEFYLPLSETLEKKECEETGNIPNEVPLLDRFIRSLSFSLTTNEVDATSSMVGKDVLSCCEPQSFEYMLPVSLTTPLPEEYISAHQQYVRDIQLREKSIYAYQKQMNEYQFSKDKSEDKKRHPLKDSKQEEVKVNESEKETPLVSTDIPPIPQPPSVSDFELEEVLFPPIHLVKHLDFPSFFQSKTASYYNLLSNNIADPQYVGANAPGLLGLIQLLSGNMQDGTVYATVPSYASGGPGSSKEKGALPMPSTGKGKKAKGRRNKLLETVANNGEEEGTVVTVVAENSTPLPVPSDSEMAW